MKNEMFCHFNCNAIVNAVTAVCMWKCNSSHFCYNLLFTNLNPCVMEVNQIKQTLIDRLINYI